jgi:hypothetical protein
MPVNAEHPEYKKIAARWALVRDIINNDAAKYIRTVDINDYQRSQQYKDDAILTNFTRLTKEGLTGLVFRKDGKLDLPQDLDYLLVDATGTNLDLHELAKFAVGDVQETGRLGLLVDYPPRPEFITKEQEEMMQYKARIKPYTAESIINWKTITVGSKTMLSMVVLRECVDCIDEKDGFNWVEKEQYRVLFLDENGMYNQQIWDEQYNVVIDSIVPLDANGQPFMYIPFHFIGSENNDWHIDPIPLYDLAVVNLGHYRNSADYEESIFLNGQPTAIFGGDADIETFKEVYGNNIKIGSRMAYYLGPSAKGEFMQTNPNQLADTAMQRKEEQAVAIGARLIAPAGGRETAEAARIRYGSQNSALHTLVDNVSKGIKRAILDVARFMGVEVDVEYELNRQFYEDTADAQLIAQQIMLLDRGVIAADDIRDYMKRTNAMDDKRSNDDIESDVLASDPLMQVNPDDDRE